MKKLIINADDFGLSEAVNRGVEAAFRRSAITSATLLANFPAFDHAAEIYRANPQMAVGAHLNLIRGLPISPPEKIAPLLNSAGRFCGSFWEIGRRCRDRKFLAAAEYEYRAQIEKIIAAGFEIDHLDFEKHHALWRPLYEVGEKLATEYGVAIRGYREPPVFVLRCLPFAGFAANGRATMMFLYQFFAHRKFYVAPCPALPDSFDRPNFCRRPDYFFGQTHIGAISEKLLAALIENLPDGVSELMCHPGYRDAEEENRLREFVGKSWITERREAELNELCRRDWRDFSARHGVELTTYKSAWATN